MKNKTLLTTLMFLAVCCFGTGVVLTALDGKWQVTVLFISALMFNVFIYLKALTVMKKNHTEK